MPRRRRLLRLLLPLVLAGAPSAVCGTGCGAEEPVLRGVPEEPILQGQPSTVDLARRLDAPDEQEAYRKPPGVHVDVAWLGGRSFRDHRDVISAQLGGLIRTTDLGPDQGQELVFEKGKVRVADGEIYMIEVPLPSPVRRSDALASTGFPPHTGRWVILHREYRLNNAWDFRRIRFPRASSEGEEVTAVQAWRHVPGEMTPEP